jgi:hypothetical protein
MIPDRHQAKAAYRLLDCEQVTHRAVLEAHTAEVLKASASPGDYLLIEDTTAIAYPGLKQAEGLGLLGEDYTRGLWAHQTLVLKVDWSQPHEQLLGLLGQQVWARQPRAASRPSHGRGKESNHARQQRDDRESRRWMRTLTEAGGASDQTTWTYVADRESDIYELFQRAWAHGFSYVIRASHPRALREAPLEGDLLSAAAAAPQRGVTTATLNTKQGEMQLRVRSTPLTLRGPSRPGGPLEDHTLNVVHALQCDAAANDKPAQWTLLTDLPVDTLEQCEHVLAIYRRRWLVEELHKALKTGLKVEASQLSDARRLSALIGILSVIAVFLLQQKLGARQQPEAALDEQALDPSMVAVLRKTSPPPGPPTQRWFWIAIAKLGGYHDKRNTHPGWLTLWRGWQTLMQLTRGYDLARSP